MLSREELDISSLPNAEALLHVFDAFDHLHPGDSILVKSDQDLRDFVSALHSDRPELFDWFQLEDGPNEFEIEICRRRDGRRPNIGEFMERDHRRLERLLCDVESRTRDRMFASALRRLHHLDVGLTRHIDLEERFLFPEYERIASEAVELVRRLQEEHVVLTRHVAHARAALQADELEEAEGALSDLRELLVPHASVEVRLVYPVIDLGQRFGAAELARQMQSA